MNMQEMKTIVGQLSEPSKIPGFGWSIPASTCKIEVKVHSNGIKYWYQNGQLHRVDGPAIEYSNGTKYWYQNGQLHRVDGPAIEYSDGSKKWYIEGNELTEEEFLSGTSDCNGKLVEIEGKKYKLSLVE